MNMHLLRKILPGVTLAVCAVVLSACDSMPNQAADAALVTYACEDGSQLRVRYAGKNAEVALADGTTVRIPQQRSATGAWYATPGYQLRSQGSSAMWTVGRNTSLACQSETATASL